jgi:STE24 endopeptidase
MSTASIILSSAIGLRFLVDYWLDRRQVSYVRAHRDELPAAFAHCVTLEEHRKAADYTITRVESKVGTALLHVVLLVILIFEGKFAALQALTARIAGTGHLGSLALAFSLGAIHALVAAQSLYHQTFSTEARFGFNRTTRPLFLLDLLKAWAIRLAFLAPVVIGIDYIMRTFGANWWLVAWGLWIASNLFAALIAPTLVMPLFNRFEPLSDGPLLTRVETLLARCGVAKRRIYTMDNSRRSSHGNAFFTGLGPSRRIVLFDTLSARLTNDEITAVLAHEIGHYKLRHIAQRIILHCSIGLPVFALMGYLSQQAWFFGVFKLDPALGTSFPFIAVLMFLLILPVFAYWLRFVRNLVSRRQEFQADRYAATNASGIDLASALVKLQRGNASTLTPDPLFHWFHASHPTVAQRIARLDAREASVSIA